MYISRIKLKNIRCFENFSIEFEKLRESILIAGDNGNGKSTILRSIAMGLCDESSAAGLLRELEGDFVCKGAKKGTILIRLKDKKALYDIETNIIKTAAQFERVSQKIYEIVRGKRRRINEDDFPWDDIFVSAYGAGLRTLGTADFQHYLAVDAVYPLFRYDVDLQNPELAFRRIIDVARKKGGSNLKKGEKFATEASVKLIKLLKQVLDLDAKDDLALRSTGIEIKRRGQWKELGVLGDGHKSTVIWILDLLSWWMLYWEKRDFQNISGIVLIDEVEQHLHPRWQLNMMNMLRSAFPKIQFIVTTHSPLVISGVQNMSVYTLNQGRYSVFKNVHGWLAEDVYRKIMGLQTSRSKDFKELIQQYQHLHFKSLQGKTSDRDNRELTSLKRKIKGLPGTDPTALITELRNLAKDFKPTSRKTKK